MFVLFLSVAFCQEDIFLTMQSNSTSQRGFTVRGRPLTFRALIILPYVTRLAMLFLERCDLPSVSAGSCLTFALFGQPADSI